MKAIAISDISGGSAWSSEHSSWHYSSKRSQNMFHPVSLPHEEQYSAHSKSSRVSRSLFGPSDPIESRRIECEEFNSQRYGDRSRWNFDFYQEKPLAGRYEWRKIGCNGKEANHASGDQNSEFLRSCSKSPKKYSGDENYMDFKRPSGASWNCLNDSSGLFTKSRSPDSKKKLY